MVSNTYPQRSDYFYFKGKTGKWTKLQKPDQTYNNWAVQLYIDGPSLDTFNKLKEKDGEAMGILNELKNDEEGDFISLRRPAKRKWKNEEIALEPPIVVDNDGKIITEEIGIGSDVICKVECYRYRPKGRTNAWGRAIRLEAVKVVNLVPYDRAEFITDFDQQVADLSKQSYNPGF